MFSCGVESVVSAVFNENDKAQCVFVADTAEEATAGHISNSVLFYSGKRLCSMKTTFDFNFDYIKLLNSMITHKHRDQEKLSIKKPLFDYLQTCNSKTLLTIKPFIKKLSSLY